MKFINNEPKFENNIEEAKKIDDLQRELAAESKPVEPEKPAEIPKAPVSRKGKINRIANFRKEPEQSSDVIDVLIPGTKLEILGNIKDLYKVNYNGTIGYVKKLNVDETR